MPSFIIVAYVFVTDVWPTSPLPPPPVIREQPRIRPSWIGLRSYIRKCSKAVTLAHLKLARVGLNFEDHTQLEISQEIAILWILEHGIVNFVSYETLSSFPYVAFTVFCPSHYVYPLTTVMPWHKPTAFRCRFV